MCVLFLGLSHSEFLPQILLSLWNIKRPFHEPLKWYFAKANWWFGIKTDQLSHHKCQKGFVLPKKMEISKQIWQDCRTFRVRFLKMFCNPVKFAYWFTPFNVKRNHFDTCGKIIDQFWCQIINCLMRNITFATHAMNAWCFFAETKISEKSTVSFRHPVSRYRQDFEQKVQANTLGLCIIAEKCHSIQTHTRPKNALRSETEGLFLLLKKASGQK